MVYISFEIVTVLFECLLVHVFFNAWFGTRMRNSKSRMLSFMAVYFTLQCVISLIMLHPALRMILGLLFVLYIAAALYETTRVSAIYSALLYIALAVVSEYLCLILLNLLGFDTDMLMSEGNIRVIYLALAKTVHLLVVLTAASVLRKNRIALTLKQVIPLFPCLIVSIYICIVFFSVLPEYGESVSLALMIAVVGLLYINGIVILHTQFIKSATVEAEEQKLALQNYEMQEQYYRTLLTDREETRTLWHDLKKHVTAIEALVASGNNQHAIKEYEQIQQAFKEVGNIVDIENMALNAILYHNITRAKSESISVSLNAHVPPELPISAVDLSVIIGNTFDNAIEECITLVDINPWINVSLVQKNSMLFYEISNPCMQIPHKKAGNIHGYGLRNVKRCVDKYGGSMVNEISDGQYRVSIRLCYALTIPQTA